MSILDKLIEKEVWHEFFQYKCKNYISKKEEKELLEYIEEERYRDIVQKILKGNYNFGYPKKSEISKMKTGKKRVVYSYDYDEAIILKMINYLLYEYDYLFCDNCYSFRKNSSAHMAIRKLTSYNKINEMYGYKLDIKNYFNSIDISILLPVLKSEIEDEKVYNLFEQILTNKKVYLRGEIIEDREKGIMAGVPISSFLANFYLKEMDWYFYDKKILYARYSDDIILFAKSEEELKEYVDVVEKFLKEYSLLKNPEKEYYIQPNSEWEFLGFSFLNGKIDLSHNTKCKIKGKIRRSARAIRRWKLKKEIDNEKALKVMIKKFNKKFFFEKEDKELNWSRWFFPVINVTEGLKEVDVYLQDYLRYMITGKHNKKNYEKIPYSMLKEIGYKSLVHEYFKCKKEC